MWQILPLTMSQGFCRCVRMLAVPLYCHEPPRLLIGWTVCLSLLQVFREGGILSRTPYPVTSCQEERIALALELWDWLPQSRLG